MIRTTPIQRFLPTRSFKNHEEASSIKILFALESGAAILSGVIDRKNNQIIASSIKTDTPIKTYLEDNACLMVVQYPCQPDKEDTVK